MTIKNKKTIMTSVILSTLLIISGTGYALAQNDATFGQQVSDSLSITEKDAISKSIKSYEVKSIKSIDTKAKIALDQFHLNFKGKQYDLRLIEDENLNNAEYYIEIGGVDVLQKSNDVAYVGYVVGEPGSRVSLVVSDNSVSGFISTIDKEIAIEPLSFYGKDQSGERQIMYDQSDLDFEFSLTDDVKESSIAESKLSKTEWIDDNLLPMVQATSGHLADLRVVTDTAYYNINTSTCGTRVLTIVGGMNTAYSATDATMNLLAYTCGTTYMTSSSTSGTLTQLKDQFKNSATPSRDLYLGLLGSDKDYAAVGEAISILGIDLPQTEGYAVAQMVDDSASSYNASLTEQKILASHETGHVMGANHNNSQISGKYTIMAGGLGGPAINESTFTFAYYSASKTEINTAAHSYL